MSVKIGQWVKVNVAPGRDPVPMMVTHVASDDIVSGVAFSGERAGLGWRYPAMDYPRIHRGDLPRQWQPYPKGEGPSVAASGKAIEKAVSAAVGDAMTEALDGISIDALKALSGLLEGGNAGQVVARAPDGFVLMDLPEPAGTQGEGLSAETVQKMNRRRAWPSTRRAARKLAIRAAIQRLDRKNPNHFSKAGLPLVAAIEANAGFDIDASERDTEWAALQAG